MHMTSGGATMNGALQYAVQLAVRQSQAGHQVWMLTPAGSYVAQSVADTGVQHVPSALQRWPLDELRRIRDFINEQQIELVHGHTSRGFNFGVSLRRLFGVPCISTAHSNKIQVHWCLADHVIAVSKVNEAFHRRWNLVRRSRISMIHNPIDVQRFHPLVETQRQQVREEIGIASEALMLLLAGHIVRRKGQLTAVHALPKVLDRFPTARLVFVGTESHEYGQQLRQEIDRMQLSDAIHILDTRMDIERIFGAADVCLCPSLDEPFGLTACEALASEVPVVASRLGGFLETVQDGGTGLLVPRKSPVALADAILKLLEDPQRRAAYGRAGRVWVQQNLAVDVHDAAVEQVYRSVCVGRTMAAPAVSTSIDNDAP